MSGGAASARALARMAVLALLWGSTFLWIKLALEALSPVQVTLARCVLGSVTLLVACLARGGRLPHGGGTWARIAVAALFCNALPFALFSLGEQTVSSGLAGVLNATTPLWSLLIGLLLGTERGLRLVRLGGLLLGFAGVVVILAPWQRTGHVGWGALAIVAAAASYAVGFTVMGRTLVGRGHATISLSAAQLLAATALTALTLPAGGLAPMHLHPTALLAVVVLGVAATGVTFHLTYRMIASEGVTNAATVGYLLPIVSVILGALVLHEHIGLRTVAGMAVVLVGVALTRRTRAVGAPASEAAGNLARGGSTGREASGGRGPAGDRGR